MEGGGDKGEPVLHEEESIVDRGERSASRNAGRSKRKHGKIAEEVAVVRKSRSGAKGRKEICVNGLEFAVRKRRRKPKPSVLDDNTVALDVLNPESVDGGAGSGNLDDLGGGSHELVDVLEVNAVIEEVDKSDQSSEVPELTSCLEGSMLIPKRPRGASRRKKSERSLAPRRAAAGLSDFLSTIEVDTRSDEAVHESVSPACPSAGKTKRVASEKKDPSSRNRKRVSAVLTLQSNDDAVVDGISKENAPHDRKSGKTEGESHQVRESDDSDNHADEEELLEHNAAKMLSSRFDPRFSDSSGAGTCSERRASKPRASRRRFSSSQMPAVDESGRLLRPRKQDFKSLVRKRRHFYEVHASNMDSYWVLKKKIKVFCSLDHGWCFGLVKDFDSHTGKHLIKYESRDEEWIDLQSQRIKLLLFPNELTGKYDSPNVSQEVKGSGEEILEELAGGESSSGSLNDLEPIMSYYTRLTQRVKKSSQKVAVKNSRPRSTKTSKPACGASGNDVSKVLNWEMDEVPAPMNRNNLYDRRFSFMYSRKKRLGRVKQECENIRDNEKSISLIIPGSCSIIRVAPNLLKLERGRLQLSLEPLGLLFLSDGYPLCKELPFPLQNQVMHCWPVVHMELVFVDKAAGWRFISFEGCVSHLVVILFLIMKMARFPTDTSFVKMRMPCALISFKFPGVQDLGRHPVFMYLNLEREHPKWAHLGHRMDTYSALMMRQVSFSGCNPASVERYLHDADLMPYIFRMVPLEDRDGLLWDHNYDATLQNYNSSDLNIASHNASERAIQSSSATESSLSQSQHLKLPLEKGSLGNSQNCSTISAYISKGNHEKITDGSFSVADDSSDQVSEITLENTGSSQSHTAEIPSCSRSQVEADALSLSSDDDWKRSSKDLVKLVSNGTENPLSSSLWNMSNKKSSRSQRLRRQSGSWRAVWKQQSQFMDNTSSPDKSDDVTRYYPAVLHAKKRRCIGEEDAELSKSDLLWTTAQDPSLASPDSKGFCIMQHPCSPDFSCFSDNYPADLSQDGYSNGYRKPRTQVLYSLPPARYDLCRRPKTHKRKGHSSKKIKVDRTKMTRAVTRGSLGYSKSFTCEANVLVTEGDKGWREYAAHVVLDSEGQGWKLLVKLSGNTKYSYKADQFIQPGTTNRFTHAMMWKGGSNWALEFTDRSQWASFREMHEECYNRNIRAASVKNIPIPGVRLIEDNDNYVVGFPFVRCPQYLREVRNEVDLALDPSRIVYDMDSDDEEFVTKQRNLIEGDECKKLEISDDLFETAMGMLEKFTYAQKCSELSESEIESVLGGIAIPRVTKSIYEHWRGKRQKKGVSLIRQFQPPLWEQYQQKLKEWEMTLNQTAYSSSDQQEKNTIVKPPMFAFCLKPRRLKVPNKNSNQRLPKKFSHQNPCQREHYRTRAFGRKLNRLSVGDDEASVSIVNCRSHQHSLVLRSEFSPRFSTNTVAEKNGRGRTERIQHLTLRGSNPKKMGMFLMSRDPRVMEMAYDQRTGSSGYCTGLPECSSTGQIHPDGYQCSPAKIEEFRLRDASSAAQHALNMAKLKREKAQWLLRKADLALHKATVALITAEAIKASEEDLIGDG